MCPSLSQFASGHRVCPSLFHDTPISFLTKRSEKTERAPVSKKIILLDYVYHFTLNIDEMLSEFRDKFVFCIFI